MQQAGSSLVLLFTCHAFIIMKEIKTSTVKSKGLTDSLLKIEAYIKKEKQTQGKNKHDFSSKKALVKASLLIGEEGM